MSTDHSLDRDMRDQIPEPGDTPAARLRHTLAAYAAQAGDDMAIHATGGVYDQPTGITWDDLRAILNWLDLSEEHLRPNHPVFRAAPVDDHQGDDAVAAGPISRAIVEHMTP